VGGVRDALGIRLVDVGATVIVPSSWNSTLPPAAGRAPALRVPPGNRLEKLAGDRAGQYSIRINQQWRICFRWTDAGPEDAEITDYH
jgi:hypothetical protein